MKQYVGILFLVTTMQLVCSEDNELLNVYSENNNLIKKRDSVSGLLRCCVSKEYTFEYRSQDNYNKNACTRPLKKIVDWTFCENRDSCCIKNGIDPKNCFANCAGIGIPGSMIGGIGKFVSTFMFTDPQNMDRSFCSQCACDFGWFPSCSRSFNCGDGTNPPMDAAGCGQCIIWGSTCLFIPSCAMTICLLTRELLKEKGQNDRSDY